MAASGWRNGREMKIGVAMAAMKKLNRSLRRQPAKNQAAIESLAAESGKAKIM